MSKKKKSWIPPFILLLCLGVAAPVGAADNKWNPWIEFGGYYGTDNASRGEVVLFAPLTQDTDSLFFTDIRGKLFERGIMEGNLALGYRQMSDSLFNYGAWIGADLRHTDHDNNFWQLSGGFEALSESLDARFNWYGPATSPQKAGGSFADVLLKGNNIYMVGGREVAQHGVDAEVGLRLPVGGDSGILGLYVGGFYFDHDESYKSVKGPKARVELALNDILPSLPGSRLTAEYEYSDDDLRRDRHQIGLRLRIPFGAGSSSKGTLTGQARRMVAGLERDTDIVFGQSEKEGVEDFYTEVPFDRVAYIDGAGSVTATSTAAGNDSLLIQNGNVTGPQTLQGRQTLQGGGSTIPVRGQKSGAIASFTAPGTSGRLEGASGEHTLALMGSRAHIAGLTFQGGMDGINSELNAFSGAFTQLSISDIDRNGIYLGRPADGSGNDNRTITFRDIQIESERDGIYMSNSGISESLIS